MLFRSKNLELNDIRKNSQTKKSDIIIKSEDANKLLLDSKGFDYIDIDPFGSPNDFLENSIIRLSRNGILAVTATDTAPLSGTYPNACMRNYWAKPLRNYLMHEVGLRILIRKIQLIGASHDKALIPIYSYFKDHYFRIFFRCIKSKDEVDKLLKMHKYLLYCECMNFCISDFNNIDCKNCDKSMIYSGPMFVGKIFDEDLAKKIYEKSINGDKSNGNKYSNAEKYFIKTIYEESMIETCEIGRAHV